MPRIDFTVTRDVRWITDLMSRPEIIQASYPDGFAAPTEEEIELAIHSGKLDFVRIGADHVALGFFVLELKFPVMEIHTVIGKEHRGATAFAAARKFTGWCFDNYPMCDELVTQVPPFNRPASLFAARSGLRKSEKLGDIFTKNGKSEHMNTYTMKRGA